ncbi:dienelactone hydrolase family protein [Methanocrinis sp.]|uniref:dienelactone hydrolase family protein n=1 Tax=Methanocrinis sp. TaxID=3101522 RepID=UPI003D0B13A4
MKKFLFILAIAALVCTAGCADREDGETSEAEIVGQVGTTLLVESMTVDIESVNLTYPAYVAAPAPTGDEQQDEGEDAGEIEKYPGIVMIHSFNGLEPGYLDLADALASAGFVVIAPEWQTFERAPMDEVVEELVRSSVDYLKGREDMNAERLGLTGFCAGGRYTMLFLPSMEEFSSGVAWYGFPYSGGFNNETKPADLIDQLDAPILIIHGTRDSPSPISEIYQYATALDQEDKYFELKVYQGEPHGFMIEEGELSESFPAQDALDEMARFFERTLK